MITLRIFQSFCLFCLFLLILEFGSRALLSIKSIDKIVRKVESDVVYRWKWVERHKEGVQIQYRFDKYDPLKGWGLTPNLSYMPCFNKKFINSNSRGIRGKAEYSYAKVKGKLRILFLGDSFTFGDEVSDNETYPSYLQQMMPNVEVINLGIHGYGHDQMLIYLKEEGIKYKPDIIILGYMGGDNERNMLEFRDYSKPRFKLKNNQLKVFNTPVPAPEIMLKRERWRSKFLDLLSILMVEISRKNGAYDKEEKSLTYALLKEIVNTAKSIGSVPIFAYLTDVRSMEFEPDISEEEKKFLIKCKSLSVNCIFLRQKIFFERLAGLRIKEDGHFDPQTNWLIALGIEEYLLNHGFGEGK